MRETKRALCWSQSNAHDQTSDLQHPGSRQVPNTNHQTTDNRAVWNLEFGCSLDVGVWCLALQTRHCSKSTEEPTTAFLFDLLGPAVPMFRACNLSPLRLIRDYECADALRFDSGRAWNSVSCQRQPARPHEIRVYLRESAVSGMPRFNYRSDHERADCGLVRRHSRTQSGRRNLGIDEEFRSVVRAGGGRERNSISHEPISLLEPRIISAPERPITALLQGWAQSWKMVGDLAHFCSRRKKLV